MKQLVCGLLALSCSVVSAAPARRPIAETDLLKFRWIADPRISPDGREVAYVLVTVNEKEDRYDTSVWTVATSGDAPPRPLTAGPRDSAPRWSPDSRTLAFLRATEKDPAQIHLLTMAGGEARKLTDVPSGASAAVWSPNGSTLAFTSGATPEEIAEQKQRSGTGGKSADPGKKKSDVRVVTLVHYRSNGDGLLDLRSHAHIWTVSATLPRDGVAEPRQLTSGSYDEEAPFWSADGSRIYFVSDRAAEPAYARDDSNVYLVPAAGGAIETALDVDGPVGGVAPSPDGKAFAFIGWINATPEPSYTKRELLVFRAGKAESLTADSDGDVGNWVAGDQRSPRGGGATLPLWTPDGSAVIVGTTERGRLNLTRIDVASRQRQALTTGDQAVLAYTATPDTTRIALAIEDGLHLAELSVLDTTTGRLTRLTHENDALLEGLQLSTPERIVYRSFDGAPIEGWLVKPPDFDAKKKYPLILSIHGGPHLAYGDAFMHEFQWLAARGYVVLAPNPRGSASYGRAFGNSIQYNYPGDDYKDLMAGVDELLRRGSVDEKKLGVTGGSGGGLLTNWTVTQTGRFAAAVAQRSIADWAAFWYATDLTLFTPSWFRKHPFQDPEEYRRRSPLTYVDRITTPLMLMESERDLRTPTDAGGGAMFRALKALHKPAVMVVFPGETHELARSGKPSHRIERLQHIVNWFDKYLLGKTITDYDARHEQP
jgi:dipeptidyl aminopeptidase/acylaminoacyl peptidase